ncbi:MAG TPA: dihydrodipicolinate synthase family protein [Candidatus Limnocylindrales bacterium]|nr:dihydrodipicolinate synthase family protein [Candidatus Limnocylindrales bacterium]
MSAIDQLRGVWNIVPTPFAHDGSLDEASIGTLVDFVIGTGVDGMTVLGVMGEVGRLSDDERRRVLELAISAAAGRIPVCAGVSHAATDRAVAFAREAQELGAHSVMLAPPALAKPNDEAVRAHYAAVAGAIAIPVVVQDHPASSSVWMSTSVIGSIACASPLCRVVKLEEEPSPPKIRRLLRESPDLVVLGGLGAMLLIEELRAGASGTMTGFGYPDILVDIVRRWFAGDVDGARAAFYRAAPLIRFENQAGLNLTIRKEIYRRRGAIASARVRAPGSQLDAGTIADLEDLLAHLELPA